MADGFRIPFQEAESEFVEKRSRFCLLYTSELPTT